MLRLEPPTRCDVDPLVLAGQELAGYAVCGAANRHSSRDGGTDLAHGISGIPQDSMSPYISMVRVSSHSRVHWLRPADPFPRLLAEFSTEPGPGQPSPGRWTRLRITQLGLNQFLCEKTRGPEPLEERRATVNNLGSAKAFFGGGWVVRELFAKLDPKRFPRWP